MPAQKVGCLILVSAQTVAGAARRAEGAGLYTRVSSHEQKCGLDGQVARLSAWADKAGLPVVRVEAEAGSGMSGLRAKVRRLLSDLAVAVVVSGHRDRLGRVNAALVEAALAAHSRLVVLGDCDVTDGLVGDMVEVLTWLCARLYGRRQARNRVLQALGCAADSEVVVYCRVPSPGQNGSEVSGCLDGAVCLGWGVAVSRWVREIGGGMNLQRPKFTALMDDVQDGRVSMLLVARKDRLARFGLEYLEHVAPRAGCEIVVANQLSLSPERELTEDLLAIVHTFCCRLYGLRKYRKTLQQALTADVTR